MFIFVYICMCISLDIYHSCSFTFISLYLYSYIHYMASGSGDRGPTSSGDASVHGGGQSAESGIARRSSSTAYDRQRLFRDIVLRLSHAMEVLDISLSSSPTLPNREKVMAI